MSIKTFLGHTFEYDAPKDDPGVVELRIHFNFTPGTPETGRFGPPENYDPGSGHEVEYLHAEREAWIDGVRQTWNRLKKDEWLDEYCRRWLGTRDAEDFAECIPERDPDQGRD